MSPVARSSPHNRCSLLSSLSSYSSYILATACFPSTCGKHLHRWSLSFSLPPLSLSLSIPLIYSHPSILSLGLPVSLSFYAGKGKCWLQIGRGVSARRNGPRISGSKLRGWPKHIFIMKSQHGMGRPCAAAGLICSKHVQIGRPTQTIKVEWRFCSTRHFCLTRGTGTPSKEQTDHKRKKKTHTGKLDSLKYSRITQRRTDCCCFSVTPQVNRFQALFTNTNSISYSIVEIM